jgi:hypothetical protein
VKRTPLELETAKRLISMMDTRVLEKCLADPIKASDPDQHELNEEFDALMKAEIVKREETQS